MLRSKINFDAHVAVRALWTALVSLLCLTGCRGIGPGTIARDRFDYTLAISDSWKRQTLLNLVKIRYADAPVFLEVSSVISQYLLETELQGSLAWNAFLPLGSQNITGRGRYADRPTITYLPLTGEKFTRSVLTPLPPSAILSLIQSRWRADLAFRVCVQSINGIDNHSGGRLAERPADPDFYRLINLLVKIQESSDVGVRIATTPDKKQAAVMFFRTKGVDSETADRIKQVRKLLGLNPEQQEFPVVYGALAKDDMEIAILSRSMMDILFELASYIEVPAAHLAENRTFATITEDTVAGIEITPLIRIQSGTEVPSYAFVAVRYRDHWYWIDDRELSSKRLFSFLMFLFSLAETGERQQAPVLTIPAG